MSSAQEDRADGWQRQAGQHLATIAALARQNREKDARIAEQAARIAELEAALNARARLPDGAESANEAALVSADG